MIIFKRWQPNAIVVKNQHRLYSRVKLAKVKSAFPPAHLNYLPQTKIQLNANGNNYHLHLIVFSLIVFNKPVLSKILRINNGI